MEKKVITIACNNGTREVEAELFKVDGYIETFGVSIDGIVDSMEDGFVVTELSTGMKVCESLSKTKAINLAKKKLQIHKDAWPDIKKKSLDILADAKIKFPLNKV